MQRFRRPVNRGPHNPRSLFRIFQGAPGCGVLAETTGRGIYEVAIPSMADWLQERLPGE